jgi:hypothetical protein
MGRPLLMWAGRPLMLPANAGAQLWPGNLCR